MPVIFSLETQLTTYFWYTSIRLIYQLFGGLVYFLRIFA
jgi:hypothetical protein